MTEESLPSPIHATKKRLANTLSRSPPQDYYFSQSLLQTIEFYKLLKKVGRQLILCVPSADKINFTADLELILMDNSINTKQTTPSSQKGRRGWGDE